MVPLFVFTTIFLLGAFPLKSAAFGPMVKHYFKASFDQDLQLLDRYKRGKEEDSKPDKTNPVNSPSIGRAALGTTPMPLGEDGGARCLVNCLRIMSNYAPQDATNETIICPEYEEKKVESLCEGYSQTRQCLDLCPESPLKNLSTSGFKPLQFMCVERKEDFKKHMPCLTTVCDDVQKQCEPTCGSMDESVHRLAQIQQQVRGPGSRTRGADMDVPEIMQTISDNCRLVDCMGNCSREPVTKRCGADAYDLQRDTTWTMLSSMAQALSSIGLNSVWPPQCQSLVSADQQRHNNEQSGSGEGPNSTDRFVDKPADRSTSNATQGENGANFLKENKALPSTSGSSSTYAYAVLVFFSSSFVLKTLR